MGRRVFIFLGIAAILAAGIWLWEQQRNPDSASLEAGRNVVAESDVKTPAAALPTPSGETPSSAPQAPSAAEDAVPSAAASPEAEPAQKETPPSPLAAAETPSEPSPEAASDAASPTTVVPTESVTEDAEDVETETVIKGTLYKGDTVTKIMGQWATDEEIQNYVRATREVFPLTAFRAGQPYVLVCDVQSGAVKRFEYEIDQKRRLVVEGSDVPVARVEEIEYEVMLSRIEGNIDDNLFQAVADMGESPQLALLLANLFGWEINFIRDLKEGDSFGILVEKLYREGVFKGYGRTLGATFTNKGKTYEAFLFNDVRGYEHHYNPRGENLKKTLLQAPLSFTRITSGYSKSRKHPIFGDHRAHYGVDYGAPTGTPVKAVGDGVVTLRGWVGGYGNQVSIRHTAGLESMYSHLSGFSRGISKGARVRQGQVIGFVGSTGYATGPHLDFRLKQNGSFINPTKAVNPRSEPIPRAQMRAFEERMALVRAFMNGERGLKEYAPDMIAKVQVAAAKEENTDPPAKEKKRSRKKR